jgi:hypothetical protein
VNDNVTSLPIWKRGATAAERFEELAQLAREFPHRFNHVVVVYIERLPPLPGDRCNATVTRYITNGCNTMEALGTLALGKNEMMKYTNGG